MAKINDFDNIDGKTPFILRETWGAPKIDGNLPLIFCPSESVRLE